MSKSKIFLNNLIRIVLIFITLYISSTASIKGEIHPFGIAIAFALVATGTPSYIVAPLYFVSSIISSLSIQNLITNAVSCGVLLIVGIFYIGKRIKPIHTLIYLILSLSASVYYGCFINNTIINSIINLTISCISLIIAIHFLHAIVLKPNIYRLTLDENICACFCIMILGSGLSVITIANFSMFRFIGIILILCSVFTLSKTSALSLSIMYSIGYLISTLDPLMTCLFTMITLAAIAFKSSKRIYCILSTVIIDILFYLYLDPYTGFDILRLIETLCALAIFISLPNSLIEKLYGYFSDTYNQLGTRDIVNRNRDSISRRLLELSEVFAQMDIVFRQMVKGVLPIEDAIDMLTNETCNKVCNNCSKRTECYRTKQETQRIVRDLIDKGFQKGRTTLLDVPPILTAKCNRTNQILMCINQLLTQYKQYTGMINNLDSSRILIAEQLNGVSKIMHDLSKQINQKIEFDTTKESKLIEELSYHNIICNEAIIYNNNNQISITLLLRNQDIENPALCKVASSICGNSLSIKEVTPSELSGWCLANLSSSSIYDVVFGYAATPKTGQDISGDNYSLLRLGNNKFMMAVCDGMGNGTNANKTSSLAISLIENFYKAGFNNDIILNSVNRLLSLNNEDTFTALDLCVIDLNAGQADFIKLGAPNGFIKHSNTTDIIQTGALPIGILEEMRPTITKTVLNNQDIFILCSDGVTDSFKKIETLKDFINNLTTLHPQMIADKILEKTLELNQGIANDDITILVGRVYCK